MTESGLVLRRDAVRAGYDDHALARLLRSGALRRVRHGAYVAADRWDRLSVRAQHEVLCEAVLLQYDDHVALSHDSAAVRWGGPDYGLDLAEAHITHFEGGGRRRSRIVHHEGECTVLDVSRCRGGWLTSPPRTVVDVAVRHGLETGVVLADDFIRRGLTTTQELELHAERARRWPGALVLRLVVRLATGRSESVGESLGWLLFRNQRLPQPVQQFEVFGRDGRLVGRTDWAWPRHGVLGEFDGREKYTRLLRAGESVTDCVLREKRREDLLREVTGWRFVRLTWADLQRPELTAQRLRTVLRVAA